MHSISTYPLFTNVHVILIKLMVLPWSSIFRASFFEIFWMETVIHDHWSTWDLLIRFEYDTSLWLIESPVQKVKWMEVMDDPDAGKENLFQQVTLRNSENKTFMLLKLQFLKL